MLCVDPTPNALLRIAGCPTPKALIRLAACPTPYRYYTKPESVQKTYSGRCKIADIIISIKRSIKAKTFCKNSFLNNNLHNFSFPVTMCIYIKREYWSKHSFKDRKICHCTKNEVFHWRFLQQMWPSSQETANLVTFTEEILDGKFHFLCSVHPLCHKAQQVRQIQVFQISHLLVISNPQIYDL